MCASLRACLCVGKDVIVAVRCARACRVDGGGGGRTRVGMEKLSLDGDARATLISPVATGGSPRASPPPRPQLENMRPDGVERRVAGASGRRGPA